MNKLCDISTPTFSLTLDWDDCKLCCGVCLTEVDRCEIFSELNQGFTSYGVDIHSVLIT